MFEKKEKIELDNDSTKSFTSEMAPKESAKCHLGNGVKFKGEITDADEVLVEGDANIKMDTNKLTIGRTGKLRGKINSNAVEVMGVVKGTLKVSDTLTIHEHGQVSGKIEYSNLEIKLGGNISGDIKSIEKIKKIY